MSEYHIYSDVLSASEQSLGYIRAFVANPKRHYFASPSIVPAVIFSLRKSDRLVKLNDPDGGSAYSHQQHGTDSFGGTPDWRPVDSGLPDPRMAIEAARAGRTEVVLNLVDASIELRCPKCSHEYSVAGDYLPLESRGTCPSCGHEEPISAFNKINV